MSQSCGHHHASPAPRDTATRLIEAEALCVAKGERMTAARLRTLELILDTHAPVKAYDVIDRFYPEGAAKPPTVYRALSFLEQMGLIHRIESLNAFVACDGHQHGDNHHAAGFLLCECCGSSTEIAHLNTADIDSAAAQSGFNIAHITLEVRGLCQACASA